MDERDHSDRNEEAAVRLTIYRPEHEVFQRHCLCEYLALLGEPSSLPSPSAEENDGPHVNGSPSKGGRKDSILSLPRSH